MHIDFDTEFLERGPEYPVSLISIGMVAEDGREYYAIDEDLPVGAINQHKWLMANVVKYLPGETIDGKWTPDRTSPLYRPRNQIAMEVEAFVLESVTDFPDGSIKHPVQFWADCGGYDRVILGQLWGVMNQAPGWLPYWQHDIRSYAALNDIRMDELPPSPPDAHDALADARHLQSQRRAAMSRVATHAMTPWRDLPLLRTSGSMGWEQPEQVWEIDLDQPGLQDCPSGWHPRVAVFAGVPAHSEYVPEKITRHERKITVEHSEPRRGAAVLTWSSPR